MKHAELSRAATSTTEQQGQFLEEAYPGLNVEPGPITEPIPGLGGTPMPEMEPTGAPNFCGMNLLQEAQRDLFSVPREEPIGISEWQQTERGNELAKKALGSDANSPASDRELQDWLAKRSDEIDQEFRKLYRLPVNAPKLDVVSSMLADGENGGRFCVLSQGVGNHEDVYEGAKRGAISQELSDKYKEKF